MTLRNISQDTAHNARKSLSRNFQLKITFVFSAMILATACSAQSAPVSPAPANVPTQAAPPATAPSAPAPGPLTPPKLIPTNNGNIAECAGLPAGEVKILFVITATGEPTDVKILESPSEAHTACARKVVLASRFEPAMQDGKPINSTFTLTLGMKATQPAPAPAPK